MVNLFGISLSSEQILEIILAGLALGVILIVVEVFKRRGNLPNEAARKAIHVSVGLLLAALPLFMLRRQIVAVNIAFFVGVLIMTGWLHIFSAVHSVNRWTIGEYLYPLSAALIAFIFPDVRVYSYAVLILALADGFAGFYGQRYGGRGYKVWGGTKSLLGNGVFFVTAWLVTIIMVTTNTDLALPQAVLVSTIAAFVLTLSEVPFSKGFDNLSVPITAALVGYYLLDIL